ncbi:hypothetical protein FXF51_26280 [Nonomuraea sp. PA05]|uniref:hypothetical protein n=1 Tax=Nonomuraea sp. PA05 TaxID=2604466 RepID=UPI0011D39520|nr:hypothetical protein [Nonomuraea sp. PA05]TYB62224.1 hypothetical protein FXF51_26280 [Nonomuraea sp. PA05]
MVVGVRRGPFVPAAPDACPHILIEYAGAGCVLRHIVHIRPRVHAPIPAPGQPVGRGGPPIGSGGIAIPAALIPLVLHVLVGGQPRLSPRRQQLPQVGTVLLVAGAIGLGQAPLAGRQPHFLGGLLAQAGQGALPPGARRVTLVRRPVALLRRPQHVVQPPVELVFILPPGAGIPAVLGRRVIAFPGDLITRPGGVIPTLRHAIALAGAARLRPEQPMRRPPLLERAEPYTLRAVRERHARRGEGHQRSPPDRPVPLPAQPPGHRR